MDRDGRIFESAGSSCENTMFSQDFCVAMDAATQPVYIIDPESFEVLYCNASLRQYLGWNPKGVPCYKALRDLEEPCPDCVALKLRRDGVNETTEYHTRYGRWVLVRISPLIWRGREVYKLICFDITDRKRLENELHLRGEEYRAIVQQSATGILRYDIETDIASVNVDRNLDRVEEYAIPNFVDRVCRSGVLAPESAEAVNIILADVRSGAASKGYDVRLILEKKGPRWCHVNYALVRGEQSVPCRVIFSFYDNTERYEQELAYYHWNNQLNVLMDADTV
ncbi:MAG: PAS domain-containing protein, partial [Eubacteriales bacterium]|nr:PAS domain-containing protein [Eubacteriales bacterium]